MYAGSQCTRARVDIRLGLHWIRQALKKALYYPYGYI